jgi:hypothetical protein
MKTAEDREIRSKAAMLHPSHKVAFYDMIGCMVTQQQHE